MCASVVVASRKNGVCVACREGQLDRSGCVWLSVTSIDSRLPQVTRGTLAKRDNALAAHKVSV
jgi:hypothetical protein